MSRKNRTTSDTRVWAGYLIVGVLLMVGAAFAKNDTRGLDSQLTDTLAQMRADGTLERIVGRYLENAAQYLEVDTIGA